jgi:hypothetical protein
LGAGFPPKTLVLPDFAQCFAPGLTACCGATKRDLDAAASCVGAGRAFVTGVTCFAACGACVTADGFALGRVLWAGAATLWATTV